MSTQSTVYARPTATLYSTLVAYVEGGSVQAAAELRGVSVHTIAHQLDALRALYGVTRTAHLAALVFREKGDIFTLPSTPRQAA